MKLTVFFEGQFWVGVVEGMKTTADKVNPKRLARMAAKEMGRRGVSTFAQEALKQEHEFRKKERRVQSRVERERQQAFERERKVLKAKQKPRGR